MSDYIICLETSGKTCTVALSDQDQCILQLQAEGEWKHSRMITVLIKDVLEQTKININDLSAVALSQGPGSYTGLRVGASAAKGLCYALDLPLIAIDSLKILAQAHIENAQKTDSLIIPLIDARRMEVYYNIYDQLLKEQIETTNHILTPDSFSEINEALIICGDGATKAKDFLNKENVVFIEDYIEAKNMATLSHKAFEDKNFENIAYFNPFYLKKPNITKSKKSLF